MLRTVSRSLLFFVEIRVLRLVPMVPAGSPTVLIMKKKNQNRNSSEKPDSFSNLNARRKKRRKNRNKVTERNRRGNRRENYRQAIESPVLSVRSDSIYFNEGIERYWQSKESSFLDWSKTGSRNVPDWSLRQ